MNKLKIGLWCQHAGLIWLLYDLWKDRYDVRMAPRWDTFLNGTWQGDEDIIVSTLPYETESLTTGKPTIVYYTDPTWPNLQKEVQRLFNEKKIMVIGAEDCYMPEHFISGVTKFIPFAINPENYPKYNGQKNNVVIANRKPIDRWIEIIRGATGVSTTLEMFLDGLDWKIISASEHSVYKKELADSKVLFYYSNSPYTIILFEAMTVGIPIVGYNHHHLAKNHPMEKYLWFYSTNQEQIKKWLADFLNANPKPVFYPSLPNFNQVQKEWDNLFLMKELNKNLENGQPKIKEMR